MGAHTEKGNRTRFFKIRVLAKTCYRSIDEEVSKTFESAGIPLEIYKQEKPEEAKDPDIMPVENPDSNKGSEDTPRTPETEEPETEKKDKDGERKKREHEDLRRAQEEAEMRSVKRAELRNRISRIRQLALNWTRLPASGISFGVPEETKAESNVQIPLTSAFPGGAGRMIGVLHLRFNTRVKGWSNDWCATFENQYVCKGYPI